MTCRSLASAALCLSLTCGGAAAWEIDKEDPVATNEPFLLTYPNLDDPDGEVVFSNDLVVLQRLVVPAGAWEGVHSHPGNQLYVHIKGGQWSGRLGGKLEYEDSLDPDGSVGWMDAIPLSAGHDSGNTGDEPIDLIYVTLKTDSPIAPGVEPSPQAYPQVPLQLLLENDRMIVQRARLEPGQWTGPHAHPGNQVCIQITDGTWSERSDETNSQPPEFSEAGSAGWIDASDVHDMGNAGETTIDLVLITLK